jgi:hypothetical protein
MSGLDPKSIQNLVNKLQKKPKTRPPQSNRYDPTLPPRDDEKDDERERFFKEMKKRDF